MMEVREIAEAISSTLQSVVRTQKDKFCRHHTEWDAFSQIHFAFNVRKKKASFVLFDPFEDYGLYRSKRTKKLCFTRVGMIVSKSWTKYYCDLEKKFDELFTPSLCRWLSRYLLFLKTHNANLHRAADSCIWGLCYRKSDV